MKGLMHLSFCLFQYIQIAFTVLLTTEAAAITKTSVSSGTWSSSECWSPVGVPSSNDDVTITGNNIITINKNCQVRNITVGVSGKLLGSANKSISISGNITVNGTFDMKGGNIYLLNSGSTFNLGPQSLFVWSPGNNSSAGATLFKNGVENFSQGSTLVIEKWFDYTTPLAQDISGNFGDLVINSPGGTNSIVEWNQKNKFETHQVTGTLTIDQGWITLDKTGSISSTVIGEIVLTSINSFFIGHNGTHPSSFSLYTGSITNNGGKFYGLNDGNGNFNLFASGNFNNSGNVKFINNSGISGVSNGNVVIRVDGDFIQSGGDARIIYNISTTNSGTFNATFRNLILSGGLFIGQSACHISGRLNLLNITKDFIVNFNNATDKFRGTGLTSIGSSINNAGIAINVGQDLLINGVDQAEFTSSASAGDELISVHRNATIQGCTSNFNYGTPSAAHASKFIVNGNLNISGGTFCLSKNIGNSNTIIDKDLNITNGTLILKGNSGVASLEVKGKYNQVGGTFQHHSNITNPTTDAINVIVHGTFRQDGGLINFDDVETGAEHLLTLKGDSCLFTGNGKITHEGEGTSNVFGKINFEKAGTVYYERKGNQHLIEQVIQSVNNGCEVVVKKGNVVLASHTSKDVFGFKVLRGGKLSLNNCSLTSNGLYNYCTVFMDSSAVITLTNEDGLSGKKHSAFSNSIKYFLDEESVVEYTGDKIQTITGSTVSSLRTHMKYGILRIKMNEIKSQAVLNENIFIRTKLELAEGNIKLNNHVMTIENGKPGAISRIKGYIESDSDATSSQNGICWKNMTAGLHEFPFGRSSSIYLPVKFNLTTGSGSDVTISTRRTYRNNLPYPSNTIALASSSNAAETKAVDRWWSVNAPGTIADITLTYCDDENTLSPQPDINSLCALQLSGTMWNRLLPASNGGNNHIKAINFKNVSNGSQYVIVSNQTIKPFELKLFEARKNENEVLLSWEAVNEAFSPVYLIEKSTDGINFIEIGTFENIVTANNLSSYNFSDEHLPEGVSYYRLKYTNDNITSYSAIKSVSKIASSVDKHRNGQAKITSVSPNPFSSTIKIQFSEVDERAMLEIIDSEGKRVLSMPAQSAGGEQSYKMLNLEYLKKGIYFINLLSKGNKDTMKIIKNE